MDATSALKEAIIQIGMAMFADKFETALSDGGELYEQIMIGAIASANTWYGLYKPKIYHRGYTLSQRGNIKIIHSEIQVSGTQLHSTVSVANVAPHAVYERGFEMVNHEWRPGGDLTGSVPSEVSMTWEPPADVVSDIVQQAAQAVFG